MVESFSSFLSMNDQIRYFNMVFFGICILKRAILDCDYTIVAKIVEISLCFSFSVDFPFMSKAMPQVSD